MSQPQSKYYGVEEANRAGVHFASAPHVHSEWRRRRASFRLDNGEKRLLATFGLFARRLAEALLLAASIYLALARP